MTERRFLMRNKLDKDDRRLFARYAVQRKGEILTSVWKECTIFDISKRGIGMRINKSEKVKTGSTVYLEIHDPKELEPICLKGILKWIKKEGSDCVCGIELHEKLEGYICVKLRSPFISFYSVKSCKSCLVL